MISLEPFGYGLEWLPDGRAELHDPTVAAALKSIGAGFNLLVAIFLLLMFALLCVPIAFLLAGCLQLLSSLGLPPHWAQKVGPIGSIVLVGAGALGTTYFWRRVPFRRSWRIEKAMITRRWKLIGFNFGREKQYAGVYALEILHEEWSDDNGATDTLIGRSGRRAYTFETFEQRLPGIKSGLIAGPDDPPSFPRRPSESGAMPLEDRIAPEARWLGCRLATLSGFPLTMHQGFRPPPPRD